MSLNWLIDSRERLVVVTADGDVCRSDIEALVTTVASAGALAYRKLVDVTADKLSLSPEDVLSISALVRNHHHERSAP